MGRIKTLLPLPAFQKAHHLSRWCAFFVAALFTIQGIADTGESRYPSRLWKVEPAASTNVKASYILGTMHLADKDIVQLPPHIDQVVDNADSLTIEVKLDASAHKAMADLSALRNGKTLKDLIGKTDFKAVVSILKPRGISEFGLQRLKPWAVGLMLNYPPPSLDPVLDFALQMRFERVGKPIYQLETAHEQIQLFNGLTLKEQIHFLRFSLKQQKDYDHYFNEMKRLYLIDDLDGLDALAKQQVQQAKEDYLKKLFVKLIDMRNLKMIDRMRGRLKEGNALIAVGALHLTGEYGLVQLLRDFGYNVTPITANTR